MHLRVKTETMDAWKNNGEVIYLLEVRTSYLSAAPICDRKQCFAIDWDMIVVHVRKRQKRLNLVAKELVST